MNKPSRQSSPAATACLALLVAGLAAAAGARTLNGNDFALGYSEAASDEDRAALLKEAVGQLYFFRYLRILEMRETKDARGQARVEITAFEPASLMDVAFAVDQPTSLKILRDDPASRPGAALALTGRLKGVEAPGNTIRLDPVIVRHKDRLSPAVGKESLADLKPDAAVYSYTDGPRPIHVSARDRDLLQHRSRILDEQGAQAWFEFLERELAARKQARGGP